MLEDRVDERAAGGCRGRGLREAVDDPEPEEQGAAQEVVGARRRQARDVRLVPAAGGDRRVRGGGLLLGVDAHATSLGAPTDDLDRCALTVG